MRRLKPYNKFYRRYEVDLWGRSGFQKKNKTVRFLIKIQKEKIKYSANPGGSFGVNFTKILPKYSEKSVSKRSPFTEDLKDKRIKKQLVLNLKYNKNIKNKKVKNFKLKRNSFSTINQFKNKRYFKRIVISRKAKSRIKKSFFKLSNRIKNFINKETASSLKSKKYISLLFFLIRRHQMIKFKKKTKKVRLKNRLYKKIYINKKIKIKLKSNISRKNVNTLFNKYKDKGYFLSGLKSSNENLKKKLIEKNKRYTNNLNNKNEKQK